MMMNLRLDTAFLGQILGHFDTLAHKLLPENKYKSYSSQEHVELFTYLMFLQRFLLEIVPSNAFSINWGDNFSTYVALTDSKVASILKIFTKGFFLA